MSGILESPFNENCSTLLTFTSRLCLDRTRHWSPGVCLWYCKACFPWPHYTAGKNLLKKKDEMRHFHAFECSRQTSSVESASSCSWHQKPSGKMDECCCLHLSLSSLFTGQALLTLPMWTTHPLRGRDHVRWIPKVKIGETLWFSSPASALPHGSSHTPETHTSPVCRFSRSNPTACQFLWRCAWARQRVIWHKLPTLCKDDLVWQL